MRTTLRFDEVGPDDDALVGGKCAGLARLVRAQFPVPPGFVVTTAAYEQFLRHNGLLEPIRAILRTIDYADAARLEARAEQIRKLILDKPMPPGVEADIVRAYTALASGHYVAVRSSGTAEDTGQASFAGLHDTYLDIRGDREVVAAVHRCWASMWTGRAVSYRQATGFDHVAARIAVVVQRMVDATVSGVMFTANPLNGRTDEIVLNASWGLGEAIVSGMVVPDDYVVKHNPLRIARRVLGDKAMRIDRDPTAGQGTVNQPVDQDQRARFCLSDAQALHLAELGRRVMAAHGGLPQDIEWAISDGDFYLLQSRPVTGVEFTWDEDVDAWQKVAEHDEALWSGAWAAEFWSGAITPLHYSIRAREIWSRNERIYGLLGFDDLLAFRLTKYRRATAFYNLELDERLYRYLLPRALRRGALGYHPPELIGRIASEPMAVGKFVKGMLRVYLRNPGQRLHRWEPTLREFARVRMNEVRYPTREDLRTWTDEAIRAHSRKLFETGCDFMERTSLGVYVYFKLMLGALRWMLDRWCTEIDAFTHQEMISGLPFQTKMAEESKELWYLAESIRHSPRLKALFDRHPDAAFFSHLDSCEEGCAFLAEYRGFIERHGHRGQADRDIYFTRRVEDPALDAKSIGLLLKAVDPVSPEELEERLVLRREATTARVLQQVRRHPFGKVRAGLVKWVQSWLLEFLAMRDDWRHSNDRVTLAKKWAYQELGRRAVERGLLDSPSDFYFLSQEELYAVLDATALMPVTRRKISARRDVFERFLARVEVPPLFLRGSTPMDLADAKDTDEARLLTGTGVSRGAVKGRARVVRDLSEIGRILPNDILVCNSTDPAWAPVFRVISGLVVEMGGMLSHGACLSRELGLPAVQIQNAMRRIEDGSLIEIVGDTGHVRILESHGAYEGDERSGASLAV